MVVTSRRLQDVELGSLRLLDVITLLGLLELESRLEVIAMDVELAADNNC